MAPRGRRSSNGRGRVGRNAPAAMEGSREVSHMQTLPSDGPLTVTLLGDTPLTEDLPTDTQSAFSTLSVERQQDDDFNFSSPNTSPVPVPTETPATTPVRPTVHRLDSLSLPGRGDHGTGGGVGGRVMAGKFKPKPVTRRALADRIQAQRNEEGRRRERESEAEKGQNLNSRGRMQGIVQSGSRSWERGGLRGRGRGRGDVMGRGRLIRDRMAQGEASGVFGVAPAASTKTPTAARSRTTTEGAALASDSMDVDATNDLKVGFTRPNTRSSKSNTSPVSTRIKQDPDPSGYRTVHESAEDDNGTDLARVKVEILDPVYPEEQEEGSRPAPRIDIEQINLITDDEDEDADVGRSSKDKGKGIGLQSKGGLKPVRLLREEHKERVTLVNTEPATTHVTDYANEPTNIEAYISSADEEGDQIEFSRDGEKWSGVWREDKREPKYDPVAPLDAMEVDVVADYTIRNESSQITNKQVNDKQDSDAPALLERDKMKRSRRQKVQPMLQTEEDKAEHARYLEDLRVLADELGGVQVNTIAGKDAGTINLDDESVTGQPRVKDHEGRLYVFQFPPSLPTLVNKIKREDFVDVNTNLMDMEDAPLSAHEAIDLTKPDPEEAVTVETTHGTFQVPPEMITEEGFVGKLIVRKSGKVQLDWGGILLELGRGVQSDYLSTTMIIEGLDEDRSSESSIKPSGVGTGLGKVMGNFVLKPDFEAMGLM